MATVNQIYTIVNDSAREALGKNAIAVKDTSSLISLGDKVLSSAEDKDAFYKALTDRIGATAIAVRAYRAKERSVMKNDMEWGIAYQKISYKWRDSVANPSWITDTQANPFDVEPATEAVQKIFSVLGTYSFEDSLPDQQLRTAFLSAEKMGAFISGIYTNMRNALEIANEDLANLAIATLMATAISSEKATQKRYLLDEYNTANNSKLTEAQALKDADFLKYASREINLVVKRIQKMSLLFNSEDIPRHTPEDKLVIEVLADFATATASYLEADTYHKELIALPHYEEVAFWQGSGTTFAFSDVSSIDVQHDSVNSGEEVKASGIIACVHDIEAASSIIYNRRSASIYNPRAERYNIFEKADKGFAVDPSENCVVFMLKSA